MQDLVDQHLRERKQTPAMQAVMGGTFAQQIICRSVPYRSEKEEDFYQVGPPQVGHPCAAHTAHISSLATPTPRRSWTATVISRIKASVR